MRIVFVCLLSSLLSIILAFYALRRPFVLSSWPFVEIFKRFFSVACCTDFGGNIFLVMIQFRHGKSSPCRCGSLEIKCVHTTLDLDSFSSIIPLLDVFSITGELSQNVLGLSL